MPEAVTVQQRIVPGAPPPTPLTKAQKKKRKAKARVAGENGADNNNIDRPDSPATSVPDASAAALIEKAPDATDVQKDLLAPDLIAHPEPETPSIPEELKPSAIVELVTKRLKATTKKIARITTYAATDPEMLNDDQKRTLKNLPILEAIQKELGEVKKAVEVHEADLVHELDAKKLETEKAERAKLAAAVAASQNSSVQRFADILDLLRLHSLLAVGEVDTLTINGHESSAFHAVADALRSDNEEKKVAIIRGFLLGTDFDGISYARLTEITQLGLTPPRAPTPPPAEPTTEQPEAEVEVEAVPETAPAVAVTGVTEVTPINKGFSFVQESEIDVAQAADDCEWVDAGAVAEAQAAEGELTDDHVQQEGPTEVPILEKTTPAFSKPAASASAALDWATDDADLPPITDVQESIGASGSVTPGDVIPEAAGEGDKGESGPQSNSRHEEEAFTHPRGGRSRGRGFRGERGERGNRFRGERGAFRGGERGGFRSERGGFHGGERGGFHGSERGGFHGGGRGGFHGGERGGFHGGERSESQGGDRGEFRGGFRGRGEGRGGHRGRGEWRGDGEHRGRRGRARGYGADRGGAPAATTPVTAEPAA